MAASTVPAAKAALITAFTASTDLSGVRITWGGPTEEDDLAYEHIWLGRVRRECDWKQLGAQRILEEYTVEVIVQARKGGDDEQATEERMWALLAATEAAIRSDLELGGVCEWVEIESTEQNNVPIPNEWVSRATQTLRFRAVI